MMGLSFADTTDANVFYTKVMGREPVAPAKKKSSKKKGKKMWYMYLLVYWQVIIENGKKGKIDKTQIGLPAEFR